MGGIVGLIGGGISANSSYQMGQKNKAAAKEEAAQRRAQAEGEKAAASATADRIRIKARRYLSTLQARSAAGGQSSTDASVMAVRAENVKNATLDQLLVMAEAEERARQMKLDAQQMEKSGLIDAASGSMRGLSTIIGSVSSNWGETFGRTALQNSGGVSNGSAVAARRKSRTGY